MRRKVIRLAGAAALTFGPLVSGPDAQIERGPAALSGQTQDFTPIEKAAVVLTGEPIVVRGITEYAAAGAAGAPPAERSDCAARVA
jgi:hypothetical protein